MGTSKDHKPTAHKYIHDHGHMIVVTWSWSHDESLRSEFIPSDEGFLPWWVGFWNFSAAESRRFYDEIVHRQFNVFLLQQFIQIFAQSDEKHNDNILRICHLSQWKITETSSIPASISSGLLGPMGTLSLRVPCGNIRVLYGLRAGKLSGIRVDKNCDFKKKSDFFYLNRIMIYIRIFHFFLGNCIYSR